jgi:hypothetical protein
VHEREQPHFRRQCHEGRVARGRMLGPDCALESELENDASCTSRSTRAASSGSAAEGAVSPLTANARPAASSERTVPSARGVLSQP